ncbi:MAG TPA: hypothetical protein GX707_08925 [Epulopiscium sp.]|nr:hypothetical protein [Candidatus Epulonipiscium sp.]
MSINNITNQPYSQSPIADPKIDPKVDTEKTNTIKENPKGNPDIAAEYVPAENNQKATYAKPDMATIQRLKEESNQAYQHLRELVRQLLERQGLTFNDLDALGEDIPVDEETRLAAQKAIDEGGPMSPESVSDRIVDFAKAISGGDKTKLDMLRGAIEKGFKEAAKVWGGELPEISHQTYALIMDKLDAWEKAE